MTDHSASLATLQQFFETLSPNSVSRVRELYAEPLLFKDPFNEVRSLAEVEHIFAHMFRQLDEPRFVIRGSLLQGDQAFLTWEFHFRMRRWNRTPQCIRGATQIRFDASGRISLHRDYWDAAEELYEKLPLLGALMRWLRRMARV